MVQTFYKQIKKKASNDRQQKFSFFFFYYHSADNRWIRIYKLNLFNSSKTNNYGTKPAYKNHTTLKYRTDPRDVELIHVTKSVNKTKQI